MTNKKITIATIFSGIGSPEQALKRLDIEHDLIFACDNGNRVIDIDYENEIEKIKSMDTIEEKMDYANKLYTNKTRKTNFVEKTFLANYKPKYFFQDVKLLDGQDFNGKVDIFIGGSPCQSFSIAGNRGGFSDTRGTLFYEFARLVNEIKPTVFIYENVANMLKHDNGKTWETIQNTFSDIGYYFTYNVMNAKDYGIPQTRKRLFVVGFSTKEMLNKFSFPEAIPLTRTVQYFLEDNHRVGTIMDIKGKLQATKDEGGKIDEYYFLTPGVLQYVLSPGTKKFYHPSIDIDKPIAKALLSTMHNHHRTCVDNYYTTNGRIREITINEGLRLMGFPDDFNIVVSKAQMYKQIGNSIVVDVMMHLINKIIEVM